MADGCRFLVSVQSLAAALSDRRRRNRLHRVIIEPLVRCDLDVGTNPEATRVAPCVHGGQGVIGAHALVGVDDACVLPDKEGAVVAQLQ